MDLTSITLDSEEVEAQLARYATYQDRASTAIKTALSALQTGRMVVDIRTVMHEAMLATGDSGETVRADRSRGIRTVPAVAIAPARRVGRRVRLTVLGSGHLLFQSGLWRLRVPQSLRTSPSGRTLDQWVEQVPQTPAYIERRPQDLILWEATWTQVPHREFDPALLEHLDGWLFLVREVWDLTEVERGVLT